MADFLGNLLLRSGLATTSHPAAIFQPRLPALFELTGGTDGIQAPPPAQVQTNLHGPVIEPSVSLPDTLFPVVPPAVVPQSLLRPEPAAASGPATFPSASSLPGILPTRPGIPAEEPDETRREPVQPAHPAGRVVRSTQTSPAQGDPSNDLPRRQDPGMRPPPAGPLAKAPTQPVSPSPGSESRRRQATDDLPTRAVPESGQPGSQPRRTENRRMSATETLRVETVPESRQPKAPSHLAEEGPRLVSEAIPFKNGLEPDPSTQPVPVASRPAALQVALSAPNTPAIQIHIGRIEVRAVTAPAPPPASRVAPAGPKLSLEEYLHQREGKR